MIVCTPQGKPLRKINVVIYNHQVDSLISALVVCEQREEFDHT